MEKLTHQQGEPAPRPAPASLNAQDLQILVPLATEWAGEQQERILTHGIALSALQVALARLMGILHPGRVRLLCVRQLPVPENPTLRSALEAAHATSPDALALTLGYGILVREDHWNYNSILLHELAHIAQHERLGGLQQFLQRYLHQCATVGYPAAPMEQEAIRLARMFST